MAFEKGLFIILQLVSSSFWAQPFTWCQTPRGERTGFDSELCYSPRADSRICEEIWIWCLHQSVDAFFCSAEFSFHPTFSLAPPPFLEPNPFIIMFSKFPPLSSVPRAHFSAHRCSSLCFVCRRVQEHLSLLSFPVFLLPSSSPLSCCRRRNTKANTQQLCWQHACI